MSIAIPSASLDFASVTWAMALREFTFHLEATRARKTVRYYAVQLKELVRWADANEVSFSGFGKRHLDRYVAYRSAEGKSRMTLRHDGVCAKAFFAWCAKNDLIARSPLAEYEVHNAPRPAMHMPTDEEIVKLLQAIPAYWDPERNKGVKFMPPQVRLFHRDRNAAVILGLLERVMHFSKVRQPLPA